MAIAFAPHAETVWSANIAGYVSRLLSAFTKKKWIRSTVSARDSRERLLSLTAAGAKKMAAIHEKSAEQIAAILAGLGERRALVEALIRVRGLVGDGPVPARGLSVMRLSAVTTDALDLLAEYYDAVQVVLRDTPADLEAIVRDARSGIWIAYWNGEAAGCTYLHRLAQWPDATECKRLYVRPSARGKGVAQALLDAQEAFARACGFRRIYLDSKDDLQKAIELYRRRGFVDCARYNENPQATVFLCKEIGG